MTLREEIKSLSGNKRRFLLLRVADMDTNTARVLVGIKKNTYNSWMQNSEFVALYRRRAEFNAEYKQEAIQLLRRDNQLEAVLLEGKVIAKIKEELDTGVYSLIRSHLAREVYSKLISDLDFQPQSLSLTWEQRLQQQIYGQAPRQITEGEVIEGEYAESQVNRDRSQNQS